MNRVNLVFGAVSLAVLLTACGGGKSDSSVAVGDAAGAATEQAGSGATERAQAVDYTSRPITVTVTGPGMVGNMVTGSGTLGPMNCGNGGTACSVSYTKLTSVLLGALPNTGMVFLGWGGDCAGTANTCTLTNGVAHNVTATFGSATPAPARTWPLNVTVSGSGSVTTPYGGINCGTDCSETLAEGSSAAMTATPAAGYKINAWGGDCASSGSASTCTVSMSQARNVSVSFVAAADTTPPTVSSATPGAGATNVAVTSPVSVTFSKPVNCSTVSGTTFKVGAVSGTVSCSGNTATFTPAATLATAASYPVALATGSSGIKDTTGNALAGTTSWNFSTAAAPTTPPVTPPSTPASGTAFSFLAYGDSRSGNGCGGNTAHIGLVNRMVNEPAAFVFNLGDMVTGYDKSTNWVQRGDCPNDASKGSFKEIIAPLQNKTPAAGVPTYYFPVVGNHDDNYGDGWYPDKFGNGFCDVFDPKKIGIPNHTQNKAYFKDWTTSSIKHYSDDQFYQLACAKTRSGVYPDYMYYSFDYKGTHFVVLRLNSDYYDLMECSSNCTATNEGNYDAYYYKHQLDWLRYDLAQATANSAIQNTIVLMHAPLISYSDGHAPNASWPTLIKDFSKHPKVKMVISGHSHVYERSVPVYADAASPNGVRDDAKGAVYTVTGGGGSALAGFNNLGPLNAKAMAAYHYMRIDVDGAKVSVKTIGQDGAVLDTFSTR